MDKFKLYKPTGQQGLRLCGVGGLLPRTHHSLKFPVRYSNSIPRGGQKEPIPRQIPQTMIVPNALSMVSSPFNYWGGGVVFPAICGLGHRKQAVSADEPDRLAGAGDCVTAGALIAEVVLSGGDGCHKAGNAVA